MKIRRGDGLNVVPFIDVMLVLLALVLSISTFIAQGKIKVDVPNASSQSPLQKDDKKYTIIVSSDGKIYVNDNEVDEKGLENFVNNIPNDALVSYKGDKSSSLEMLVKVIDLLTTKGHQSDKFQIDTQQR